MKDNKMSSNTSTIQQTCEDLFFAQSDFNKGKTEKLVTESLHQADDGELFMEYQQSESLVFDDGQIKSSNFDIQQGFGMRGVQGEVTAYAYSSDFNTKALKNCCQTIQAACSSQKGAYQNLTNSKPLNLYSDKNVMQEIAFPEKVELLKAIDSYARKKDPRVKQVMCALSGNWQAVYILRGDGQHACDIRPLIRLDVSVVLEQEGRQESGFAGAGGRQNYHAYLKTESWQKQVDEAIRQADVNLKAIPAPAGEFQVVLGSGWPAILLHEAIGHGLEGDFNRKKVSAFSELMGQKIAHEDITVVDDGTIENRRGSINIDDEGTTSQSTTLIENGILTGYMQDRLNARLMKTSSTGNGRRESHAYAPLPRMTNTIMMKGKHEPDEILSQVKDGIYAVNFGGGQVDITSGKFVFSCTEAYKVENGKIGASLKGAMLIGNGPDVLKKVSMVGNDVALDPGVGTCGKEGQGVPVGVGQPTLCIDGLTVGGTETAA